MKTIQKFLFVLAVFYVQNSLAFDLDESILRTPIEIYDGETIELKSLVGKKPIYLKFWASWCVSCREQMPHLQHTYQEHNDEVEILSVNIWINETEEMLQDTKEEFGLSVPIAIDRTGKLAQAFELIGTPYHILIDRDGDVVHKGYKADKDLDRKIELLAAREKSDLPKIALTPAGGKSVDITDRSEDVSVLFFTATWCDWYLKESRPSMSEACIQAQKNMNQVHELLPEISILGIVSRLWTGEKELQEYVDKYAIKHPIAVDVTNDAFLALNVKNFPTMVVMKNGEEIFRTSRLDSVERITGIIQQGGS